MKTLLKLVIINHGNGVKTRYLHAYKLYVKKGNAVIDEIDMTNGYVELNRSYPMAEGERIAVYVKGLDEYGYTHEMYVSGRTTEENPGEMWLSPYQVYAPDGTNMIE